MKKTNIQGLWILHSFEISYSHFQYYTEIFPVNSVFTDSDEATAVQVSINTSTFYTFYYQTGSLKGAPKSHQEQKKSGYFRILNPLKMKTFSVAVAVAIVLTFICIQESSAAPSSEVRARFKPF